MPVTRSGGRVTAACVLAASPVPGVDVAAVDGFALRASASVGASEYNPLPFRVVGTGVADGATAVAVGAGSPLPPGTDAVLSIDDAEWRDDVLDVSTPVASGEQVIPAGREVAAHGEVVAAGRRLGARDVAFLQLTGERDVVVFRRPRVDIVCARAPAVDVSSSLVATLAATWGCDVGTIVHASDDVIAFSQALRSSTADLVVTIGATGAGEDDFAVHTLSREGEVAHHGIALNPGERTAVGRLGDRAVVQVSGLPLACLVATQLFVRRAAHRLSGLASTSSTDTMSLRLSRKVASRLGRLDFCRVRIEGDMAHPVAVADATTLSTVVRADGYVLVPTRSEGYDAGSVVTVHRFDDHC